jgi:hypothetical protein
VEYIASELRDLPFQGRIIKCFSDGDIDISAGEKVGAQVGNVFTVYSVGEELIDPDTGELLGSDEEEVGSLKTYEVKEKYSKTTVVSSGKGLNEETSFVSIRFPKVTEIKDLLKPSF